MYPPSGGYDPDAIAYAHPDCPLHGDDSGRQDGEPLSPKCPACGFTGRQANVYRKGELWSTCHDPWHAASGRTEELT